MRHWPFVVRDDGVGDGEAEAGAATLLGRAVEPVEQLGPVLSGHARPAVLHGHCHSVAAVAHA